MITKRMITLEVEMFSGASEAAMCGHMEEFCANIVSYAKDQATQSWNQELATTSTSRRKSGRSNDTRRTGS